MNSFFTSGWNFSAKECDLRSKFQMINIALLLSSISLIFGIIVRESSAFVWIEATLIGVNIVLFFLLRKSRTSFLHVAFIITAQFTFFFLYLIYMSQPSALKHIWVFTYPIVLLYLQNEKIAKYWVLFMISMLLLAPIQPFFSVQYSMHQVSYISFVLLIISVIVYFYQRKMDEAKELINQQQKIMSRQAKHAVMGEMISMIAHQWRQPLSTVTLSISNLQIKKLLGEKIEAKEVDKALQEINKTAIYLSETIDDFQTFFHPNRELEEIKVTALIQKVTGFVDARLKDANIDLVIEVEENILISTYVNEIVQVILNLLNNAIDELIRVQILMPKIVIKIQNSAENIKIFVIDNAHGIIKEDIDKVFEPYFSTKGKNGTGLGLYMSQMIMQKQFNTKIEIESSSKGSSFAIIVPKKLL